MLTKPVHRKHRVSERTSDDFTIKTIATDDFAKSIYDFICENMRGAITAAKAPLLPGYIDIAPYGFSFFLKLLLNEIYGNGMVELNISATTKQMMLTVRFSDRSVPQSIISVAEKSGLTISELSDGLIIMTAQIRYLDSFSIYALDATDFERHLLEIFFM